MGKKDNNGDKRKISSEGGSGPDPKLARNGGSTPVKVSEQLRLANSVLFDDSELPFANMDNSVFEEETTGTLNHDDNVINQSQCDAHRSLATNMAANNPPSNADIYQVLLRIDTKLNKLEVLERKVSDLDDDLKKLWNYVQDNIKTQDNKVNKCMDVVDNIEFSLAQANERIDMLERERSKVSEQLDYQQSQSMRNNLIFGNLPEAVNENSDVTEQKVRDFIVHEMGFQQDKVDQIRIERAHRLGNTPFVSPDPMGGPVGNQRGSSHKPRSIVVKFAFFKDREQIRRAKHKLKNTSYFVSEQFPKSVSDRRRALIPKLREAKADGKRAWLSYDTLYIEGKPQPHPSPASDKGSDGANANPRTDSGGRGERGGRGGGRGRGGRGRGGGPAGNH